jgi:Protein of unknown function (DUF3306)
MSMSEREGFLQRWSRRKHERAQTAPAPARDEQVSEPPPAVTNERAAAQPAPEALVDLAKLPPIESITAATDIRPFLAPGVPAELSRAALRRAWSADPAIRDFIGLAENQWDFTAPGGVPGFGSIEADQIRQLLAEIVREREPEPASPSSSPSEPGAQSAHSEALRPVSLARPDVGVAPDAPPQTAIDRSDGSMLQCDTEKSAPRSEQTPPAPRHGGALPR